MRTLKDINFEGQRAIVRVDFNVPLDKDLQITDITRIKAAKPTIDYILSNGGSCVLLSHLGRPNGFEQSLSFQNIIDKISESLTNISRYSNSSSPPISIKICSLFILFMRQHIPGSRVTFGKSL